MASYFGAEGGRIWVFPMEEKMSIPISGEALVIFVILPCVVLSYSREKDESTLLGLHTSQS